MLDKGLEEKVVVWKGEGLEKVEYGPYFVQLESKGGVRLLGQTYSKKEFGYQVLYYRSGVNEPVMIGIEDKKIGGKILSGKLRTKARNIGNYSTRKATIKRILNAPKKF